MITHPEGEVYIRHMERQPMQEIVELAKCFTRWATRCENSNPQKKIILMQENRYMAGKLTRAMKKIKGMRQAFTGVHRFCALVSNILLHTGKDAVLASTLELCAHVFQIRKDRLQWCVEEWRANQQHEFYQECLDLLMKSDGLKEVIGNIFEGDNGASVRIVFPPEIKEMVRSMKAEKLSFDNLNVECEWIDGSPGEADTLQD